MTERHVFHLLKEHLLIPGLRYIYIYIVYLVIFFQALILAVNDTKILNKELFKTFMSLLASR